MQDYCSILMNLIHRLFHQAICIIFAREMNIKLPIFLKFLNLYNNSVTWDLRIAIFEFLTPFAFSLLFVFLHLGSLCQVLTWHMYWKRMIELWEPFLTHAKAHELLLVPMIGLQPLDLSPKRGNKIMVTFVRCSYCLWCNSVSDI